MLSERSLMGHGSPLMHWSSVLYETSEAAAALGSVRSKYVRGGTLRRNGHGAEQSKPESDSPGSGSALHHGGRPVDTAPRHVVYRAEDELGPLCVRPCVRDSTIKFGLYRNSEHTHTQAQAQAHIIAHWARQPRTPSHRLRFHPIAHTRVVEHTSACMYVSSDLLVHTVISMGMDRDDSSSSGVKKHTEYTFSRARQCIHTRAYPL